MKRKSLLIPGLIGVVLAWHGAYWGLAITLACVALAWDRAGKTVTTPEAVAHRQAWVAAAKRQWTVPEAGTYLVNTYAGITEMRLRAGQKLFVLVDDPEPARVT